METIIIKASTKKAKALKQFLKAFDVPFKTDKTEEEQSPYDPEFVKKILKARDEPGGTVIDPNDLWGSLKLS